MPGFGEWLNSIFGRTKLKQPQRERLFALTTAEVSLGHELGWEAAGRAGLCIKPVTSGEFASAEKDLTELVELAAQESETSVDTSKDQFGYQWFAFGDPDFEDLVGLVHLVGQELEENGYGGQLVAALFRFKRRDGNPAFLIYNYKRGKFYPFVPKREGERERDNSHEMRVASIMRSELPFEEDYARWYPLWGHPV